MNELSNFLLIILLLLNLQMLSTGSMKTCIKVVAAEGIIIGIISFLIHWDDISVGIFLTNALMLVIKGVILPWLILRCLVRVNIKREVEPFISYTASVVYGIILFFIGFLFSSQIPTVNGIFLSLPVALMTIFSGLMLLVSRRKAITQVLGYLMFENGIYLFGELMPLKNSLIVELAILLDVFVFIFVIGITVFHIQQEFNHIDTDRLSHLSDLPGRTKLEK